MDHISPFDLAPQLIGLTKAEAVERINQAGFLPRVKREDDQHFLHTMDYRTDRISLEIDKGLVSKAEVE